MTISYPDSGLNYFTAAIGPDNDESIASVAVGSDDTAVSGDDTSLGNLLQKTSISTQNASYSQTTNVGEFKATIRVAAGTEVEAGDVIRELGLFTDEDRLVYREVRDPIEINAGESVNITFTGTFQNQ